MLQKLKTDKKIVGLKQVRRALTTSDDNIKEIYIAKDADQHLIEEVTGLCNERNIQVIEVESMEELGQACNIDVNAAVAALL